MYVQAELLTWSWTKCIKHKPTAFHTLQSLSASAIRASIQKGSPQKALLDYKALLTSLSIRPDRPALTSLLEACKITSNLLLAAEAHAAVLKSGLHLDPSLSSSLVSIYVASKCLRHARQLFDENPGLGYDAFSANLLIMGYLRSGDYETSYRFFEALPGKDAVSWNSMIAGSVKNGRPKAAISLFRRMLVSSCEPSGFTFAPVLSACARVGALGCGKWVHSLMIEMEIDLNFILSSALIDMYSKCGRIKTAIAIFNDAKKDDISIWNSMITGLAIHGLGSETLVIFSQMKRGHVVPDSITFVGVLTACSHCGMVAEGRLYFDTMKICYKIEPVLEHYGAMIDLLSRSGLLEEAYEMIKEMPMEPDVVIWRALLSACRNYGETKLAEAVIKHMAHLNSGDYVLLSNIYSSARRWDCASKVRDLMKKKGVRKSRGLSWVEIDGVIHEFKAGDKSHLESEPIYRVLDGLVKRIKLDGFVSATRLVLMDVSEEEKEANLNCHSEKLALAFAVLKTAPMTEIRVSKNLRTCEDCHTFMKMVSRALRRVIIVRDRVRFHLFESGSCSCSDYW